MITVSAVLFQPAATAPAVVLRPVAPQVLGALSLVHFSERRGQLRLEQAKRLSFD
jgi:hypothetical protein